ncbi:MAG: bifunctional riboflavin kinase/FAD synthetase [Deltaproteobacteria bacterium]|nr:bifunctional riboflavin kinase/FAD synthetase [Deltaproteobacteria bacterium]
MAIGNFDGIHLGHQALLKKAMELSLESGVDSVAFTFDPHPIKVLAPEKYLPLITPTEKKIKIMEELGISAVICAEFNLDFANLHPRSFVKNVLVDTIGARDVVVGFNYAFGKGKQGGTEFLRSMGEEYGFRLHVVDPVKIGGAVVSSSKVREAIWGGNVKLAFTLLGRPYDMEGVVVQGRKRGKILGFPTANIETKGELFPKSGVYASVLVLNGNRYNAVANVGKHPTFPDDPFSVEAHIFDFNYDIYGEKVDLLFIERIRDDVAFPTPAALVAQISQDVLKAKEILK